MITYNAEVIDDHGKVIMTAPWDCSPDAIDLLLEHDVINSREAEACMVTEDKEVDYISYSVDSDEISYTVNFLLDNEINCKNCTVPKDERDCNFCKDLNRLEEASSVEVDEEQAERIAKEEDVRHNRFKYQMLGRLQMDCEYFLGYGNRCNKHLHQLTPKAQIAKMKELYNSFKHNERPEWLTMEQIEEYEKQMTKEQAK